VKVQYEEVMDEDGNVQRTKKSVNGKPYVDNKKKFKASYDQDDEAMDKILNEDDYDIEEVVDPVTGQKSKKRVIKKDAVAKLLASHKFKGSKKFM